MKSRSQISAKVTHLLIAAIASAGSTAIGAIATTGDVEPANPATWVNTTTSDVGNTANGTLSVNAGSTIASQNTYIGNQSGVVGTASLDGSGTNWSISNSLYLGNSGLGNLNVTGGALVLSSQGYIGENSGSLGTANISGPGSEWNADTLTVGVSGTGIATITDGGTLFSGNSGDINMATDPGSVGIVTVNGSNSSWNQTNFLHCGVAGEGFINIENGGLVRTQGLAQLGVNTGSTGTVWVTGAGSNWSVNNGPLDIGDGGNGFLRIDGGGAVSNGDLGCVVGAAAGATGILTISDPGSQFQNQSGGGNVSLGSQGATGTAYVINGGSLIAADNIIVTPSSLLSMDVGESSKVQAFQFINNGTVRVEAGPGAVAGNNYTPISTSNGFSGTGTVEPLGGTWDNTTHTFTVSSVASGTSGSPVHIDQSQQQRIFVSDASSGDKLFANFLATSSPTSLTLTATPLTSQQDSLLQQDLGSNGSVLTGWTFSTDGYTQGDPVYLSMSIGSGWSEDSLKLWHFDGTTWTPYSAGDLSYDGSYASFTVNGFSGYAVTVPEPGSMAVLAVGTLTLLRRRRSRRIG